MFSILGAAGLGVMPFINLRIADGRCIYCKHDSPGDNDSMLRPTIELLPRFSSNSNQNVSLQLSGENWQIL